MIKAIIDKKMLMEKNTIQVNRMLKEDEKFILNEETDLLFEAPYLFPFAKFEENKIIKLTDEEAKIKGLMPLQNNEAVLNNKLVRLEVYEKYENGEIVINEELKKEYINSKILYLKSERVKLRKERRDFIEFEEDTTELDKKINEITEELQKLEG
ncbi:hypothetical protein [Sebaldella sp. S0638]|uniref:hypothetical protein n=1 Tax=Sebaldella sp. S0638 TaxID=2957809 RepID=UPI00209C7F01|nr:hypothetical protein [Sebaldella sp. S0638]MCP1226352.1 hypothetical protein [Sebaldella sp. S0638]